MPSRRIFSPKAAVVAVLCSLLALQFACDAMGAAYQPCNIPPVVGSASRPNVFLVMDYTGSMQGAAYYNDALSGSYYGNKIAICYQGASTGSTSSGAGTIATYDQTYSYYGTFESDKYYVYVPSTGTTTYDYFKLAPTQPVAAYAITNSAQGADVNHIVFTAAGHTFAVNDLVALNDLTSHTGLSGNAVTVTAISGDTFTVTSTTKTTVKWNGTADTGGSAVKRITGSLIPTTPGDDSTAPGVSGNVLNYAITTRIDAALKALIGGRSICDSNYCYLRAQGGRKRVQDNTYLYTDMYVRPATLESSTTFPDDYNTGSLYYKDDSGHDRDMFVTIRGGYSGQTVATSPQVRLGSPLSARLFEAWSFTLTRTTKVQITLDGLDGTSPGQNYLLIYSAAPTYNFNGTSPAAVSSNSGSSGNPASISADLAAGTYYVVATYTNGGTTSAYQKSYAMTSNVNLTKYVVSGYAHNGQIRTKIGALPSGRARVRLEPDSSGKKDTRNAVIQKSFQYVRFGFEYFNNSSSTNTAGKIVVGCDNTDMSLLVNALEGVYRSDSPIDFTNVYPYYGTNTGPAMREAQDYFAQQDSHTNATNSTFVGNPPTTAATKGTVKDPYYTTNAAGNPVPVPCRQSFVVLVSDGEWNSGEDPVIPAQDMHVNDLRGDIDGTQTVNIYSIMAFSTATGGYNAMKAIAMFGGFKHITSGCGTDATVPYPETGLPGSSLTMSWPRTSCDPSQADSDTACSNCYSVKCCAEWNKTWDRDKDGTNESKGVPDNYFQADDGKQLEDSLNKVMQGVTSGNAAASAVATVSQEMRSEDVVVRGVFQAADADNPDDFLWRGHVEAYFPFTDPTTGKTHYDFDQASFLVPGSDPDLVGLCINLGTGARHCWDAAEILRKETPLAPANRTIYTWLLDTSDGKYKQKLFDTTNILPVTLGLTSTDTTNRDNIIAWVKGVPDNTFSGYRNRNGWYVGDIVYSTPVVVGPPKLGNVSKRDPNVSKFLDYLDDMSQRPKVIYVGANDGMLHAFLMSTYDDVNQVWRLRPSGDPDPLRNDPQIGKELWAYIPSNLLTELQALKSTSYGTRTGSSPCTHRTMVDLASRHWEVYIKSANCGTRSDGTPRADSQGRCWRSVIIGGERGGGDVYFAIDITDPYNPIVLWEYSVLQNRVVVESQTDTCLQACRNTCANNYTTCYNSCCASQSGGSCNNTTKKNTCTNNCTPAKTTCENNCATNCAAAGYKAYVPFRSAYASVDPLTKIKLLPMSWSQPYLGRVHIPTTVKFYYGDPVPLDPTLKTGGDPNTYVQFDADNNNREVVFMGGGIHLYDKSFNTTPTIDDRFKLALFWPNLLMLDIETGYNLFEYVWPIVLNYNSTTFPTQAVSGNTIPYAMSDVLGLDVWDQVNNVIGDDGFIDRVYVGDMNGYFYGLKFNLAEIFPTVTDTNTTFGMEVNIWPTKPIASTDVTTDDYRSALQPITIAPAASFESLPSRAAANPLPALRLIFGTGKYDDVIYGGDDKVDTAKMALYNLRDPVVTTINGIDYGLPLIDTTTSHQVYDTAHSTNFRVQFAPHCGMPTTITSFNTNCDWLLSSTDTNTASPLYGLYKGDCCESANTSCNTTPCYQCIYDFRNPCQPGDDGCLAKKGDWPTTGSLPGERVLGKPLIASGMVFVTSYVPPTDPCGYTGQGYLYMFDYMCQPLPADWNPFPTTEDCTKTGNSTPCTTPIPGPGGGTSGVQVKLGGGVPSRAVMDSRGNVIIQMSDGSIKRLETDLGANKPVQFKGWRER